MKHPVRRIREELERFLREEHGISIIYDRGTFHGGYARIYEERKLLINRFLPDEEKASILAQAVIEADLPADALKKTASDFVNKFRKTGIIADEEQ